MARYTGPNNKQSRRVNFSVLESGVEFVCIKSVKNNSKD